MNGVSIKFDPEWMLSVEVELSVGLKPKVSGICRLGSRDWAVPGHSAILLPLTGSTGGNLPSLACVCVCFFYIDESSPVASSVRGGGGVGRSGVRPVGRRCQTGRFHMWPISCQSTRLVS